MADILSVAIGELGFQEGSNNNTKYGVWYGANYQPWCAMFVSWCASKAGVLGSKVPRFSYCPDGRDWYIKNGKWAYSKTHGGNYTPQPGDIIFFSWKATKSGCSHVGIVERVSGTTVYTIEGNSKDMVTRCSYLLSSNVLNGYGKTFQTYSANDKDNGNVYTNAVQGAVKTDPESSYNYENEKTEATRSTILRDYQSEHFYPYELLIEYQGKLYSPLITGDIVLSLERKDMPGKLTFSVVEDSVLSFTEGSAVRFRYKGNRMFYGWVFTKKRSKEKIINVTCYDQIRYLKNKDTYVYKNKTAADVIRMIANNFSLQLGTIEATQYTIPTRTESNTTLLDMIQNALGLTTQNKGKMFIFYDDFGKLTLKSLENMKIPLVIDSETAETFDYTSSIDEHTYNKIKLIYSKEEGGTREVYIAQDSSKMNEWGVLQYFDTLQEGENGKAKADALLKLYNTKTISLKIPGALGDSRIRGGSMLIVNLDLGDMGLQNWMLVEKCVHTFKENEHYMDLTLRGGEFIA
jgi:hypothetical protein